MICKVESSRSTSGNQRSRDRSLEIRFGADDYSKQTYQNIAQKWPPGQTDCPTPSLSEFVFRAQTQKSRVGPPAEQGAGC
ncbi:hypothetical protein CDAR_602951 [Caerostris darwini]|uniref:Uncharacterized protein n=1 Tax=Caerostris darwini TaxID=1538125 RepID=A0AAV4TDN5_9ARAC|nr:hypothetical protein CDAR_602951 [Caerostris darwini]